LGPAGHAIAHDKPLLASQELGGAGRLQEEAEQEQEQVAVGLEVAERDMFT
jgi:hypothetical protein